MYKIGQKVKILSDAWFDGKINVNSIDTGKIGVITHIADRIYSGGNFKYTIIVGTNRNAFRDCDIQAIQQQLDFSFKE
jgi:hypothetical protein